MQLPLLEPDVTTNETITKTEEDLLWDMVFTALTPALQETLQTVRLVGIDEGVAIIEAGRNAEWLQNRTPRGLLQALKTECPDITEIRFVPDYTPDDY